MEIISHLQLADTLRVSIDQGPFITSKAFLQSFFTSGLTAIHICLDLDRQPLAKVFGFLVNIFALEYIDQGKAIAF
jgi:hypothetical protein